MTRACDSMRPLKTINTTNEIRQKYIRNNWEYTISKTK